MTYQQLHNSTSTMTTDELIDLNHKLVSLIKHRRKNDAKDMRRELSLGDTVKFPSRRGMTQIGRVEKIMRTRCIVKCLDGTRWKVQMSTLEHA